MTSVQSATPVRRPATFPAHRILPHLVRDPLAAFERIGARADGRIALLRLGPFRPYLVTHPDHVHHVLRRNAANYPRRGMMWEPFSRLVGHGIAGEGPVWDASRSILQPAFSGQQIAARTDAMAGEIAAAVDDLAARAAAPEGVDAAIEMTRIVQRVIDMVFFAGRIGGDDADRLGAAISTAMRSFTARILMPFVPLAVPMPGDRAFRAATRTVEEILGPVVARARARPSADGTDVVSLLMRGRDADGRPLGDRRIRDDIVGLWVAGSESSAIALTWVWAALSAHPEVADRLRAEVDEVLGDGPIDRAAVRRLRYTAMVLQEVLRMHSVAWVVPRTAAAADVIGGVPIPAGATVVVSPYLTHRLPSVWERPEAFDPGRFAPERVRGRHPLAHLPFGVGAHECIGQNFFLREATLVLATILRRYRPVITTRTRPAEAEASLTVRPRHPVRLRLIPR